MSNKLALVVNFLGVDKMSGALRNIVGLGRKGSSSIRSLTGESKKLERELAGVRRELSASTGNVTVLMNSERALERQLEGTNRQLQRQRSLAGLAADKAAILARAQNLRSRGRDGMLAGATASLPLIAATRQAMTFESAMADVRKVVDFPTPRAFARMSDDVLDLSTRIPMASEGIAAIVAAAGRANIPRKELLRFAEDAAKLGVAFDISGDEAGEMMAKWRTAFGMGQADVVRLSDQVNALTNAYGGKAVEVSGIVTRIGSLGKVAGVTAPQVAAMAQLLNSVGVEEEVAATGIKNMMLAMTKGQAATKSQAGALKSLGLEATGLSERMQRDAGGAITDILQRLSRLPKAQQAGVLTDLFGSESVGAIAPMLTNLDKLQANLSLVGDNTRYAGSMQKEYLSAIATTEGAWGLGVNALKALNIELGQHFLPIVTSGSRKVVEIANAVRAWSRQNPQLSSGIVSAITGLVAFRLGLGAAKFALGGLLGPFARILPYFKKVEGVSAFGRHLGLFGRVAVQAGGLAVRAFGMLGRGFQLVMLGARALIPLIGGISLPVLAVAAAVGVAAYLIYSNWDRIRAAFTTGVNWVKAKLQGMPDWLKNIGSMMMQGLLMAINPMALAWKLIEVARTGVRAFKNYLGIKSPSRLFMAMGGHVTAGLTRGIDRNRHAPVRAISRMATGVAAAGAISLTPIQAAARPAAAGASRAAGIGSVTIHVHAGPGMNVDDLADKVLRKLERIQGRAARSGYADR